MAPTGVFASDDWPAWPVAEFNDSFGIIIEGITPAATKRNIAIFRKQDAGNVVEFPLDLLEMSLCDKLFKHNLPAPHSADFNRDGVVDVSDYNIWNNHSPTPSCA